VLRVAGLNPDDRSEDFVRETQEIALGLNVSTRVLAAILKLMEHYPQPVQAASGGVEYLPGSSLRDVGARTWA
jgi:Serine dehydrogenase proteinase